MKMSRIYLDFNATTPLSVRVKDEMIEVLRTEVGNPSSSHWAGDQAKQLVTTARSRVAKLLGSQPEEIIFTSGGTEANNHAIKGIYYAKAKLIERPHFIISSVEHPAIVKPCRFLETLGARVTCLPVDSHGMIDPADVEAAIGRETVLISIMLSNNEVGTLQPIQAVSQIARRHGVLLHTDAAQAVGKITVDVEALGVDMLTLAGHKLYAPQGIGALYVRRGVQLEPFMHGAGHEDGRRAGTENILEIVGLGAACEEALDWIGDTEILELRDYCWQLLQATFGTDVSLNGSPMLRLPNTLNISFKDQSGHDLLQRLPFLAASTGSACHSGKQHLSPTLSAMGLDTARCLGAIRLSLGRSTTRTEIDKVVNAFREVIFANVPAV